MTQPDVAITDYGLAIECLIFARLLLPVRKGSTSLTFWFVVYYLSIALAAAVGGTVHGFYAMSGSPVSRALWLVTLIAIGITSLAGTRIAAGLQFKPLVAIVVGRVALALFILYCAIALFVWDDFLLAVVDYLPVVLFLAWAFLALYRYTRRSAFMSGFVGLCVTLVATGIQQARLDIHPRYFNHNAIYHVLQAVALLMIFRVTQDVAVKTEVVSDYPA